MFPEDVKTVQTPRAQESGILAEVDVYKKLDQVLNFSPEDLMRLKQAVPMKPGRNVTILHSKLHPPKLGLSKPEGQARLMHDLASIELQAMELGLRTLLEFPDADAQFREELSKIVKSEAEHLKMCLMEIDRLGFKFGDWPIHLALWDATSAEDSLLDRILIVHRYLEGSGLDAGDKLRRRVEGLAPNMANTAMLSAMKIISHEEIGHVKFGSDFYRYFCDQDKIDPNLDFKPRMDRLAQILPRRLEPINRELRVQAGFSDLEIEVLEELRERQGLPL